MTDAPIDRERLLATFLELAQINSTARCEAELAGRLAQMLRELGAEVAVDNTGEVMGGNTGNLIARVPGTQEGPVLLFCAHMDTVEPTDRLQIRREHGAITSDGTTILGADDKAGIAAICEMVRALRETRVPHPPLELVFTIAEEIGIMGAQFVDYGQLSAQMGFVPDHSGPVGEIVTRAPAQQHLQVTIHGKASHAGIAPEEGINAITVAARAIASLPQGRIDEETTANIGVIHGGKATNIVPDMVTLEGEARSRDPRKLAEQVERMRACFLREAEAAGAVVEIEISDVYPAFRVPDESAPVRLAGEALRTLGLSPTVAATGGGSDANFINAHHIPTVILSAGYEHAHCPDETLSEDQLVRLARWLYEIVRLAGDQ